MGAKNIICLSNIVKFQCATPKQFRKSGTGINIPPNNCGKKAYNKQSWLYIKTSDDEEYWIWFEHYEIAKNWTDKITLAKVQLEKEVLHLFSKEHGMKLLLQSKSFMINLINLNKNHFLMK